jgi:oligoribonuclease
MAEIDKKAIPTKLLWIDLEMTGLDPQRDVILEVSADVTDFEFTSLGRFDALIQQPEDKLMTMNAWAQAQHDGSGLTERVRREGRPEAEVTGELAAFIAEHFAGEPAVLAGNSIHNDRVFIRQWWPDIEALLHYRMMDVSSWKILMQGKYGVVFDKQDVHRAFEDIQASIDEQRFYLDWFRQHSDQ